MRSNDNKKNFQAWAAVVGKPTHEAAHCEELPWPCASLRLALHRHVPRAQGATIASRRTPQGLVRQVGGQVEEITGHCLHVAVAELASIFEVARNCSLTR